MVGACLRYEGGGHKEKKMVGTCLIFEGGGHKDKYKDKDIKMVEACLI